MEYMFVLKQIIVLIIFFISITLITKNPLAGFILGLAASKYMGEKHDKKKMVENP